MTSDDVDESALHDVLTGLPARSLVVDRLARAVSLAAWQGRPVPVLVFTVTGPGAQAAVSGTGQSALASAVASRVARVIRPHDTLGVLGEGVFVVLMTGLSSLQIERVLALARRILHTIGEPLQIGSERVLAEAHVGISLFPDDSGDPAELLALAEAASMSARGERAWQFSSAALDAVGADEARLAAALRRAVLRSEFSLWFAPRVRVSNGAPIELTACPGWDAPEGQGLSCARLLELAEDMGLGQLVEQWMLDQVLACLQDWMGTGLGGVPVCLPVGAAQFNLRLPERVQAALRRTQCDPRLVGFAVAESTLLADMPLSRQVIEALRGLGCPVQVVDPEGGLASLRALRRLALTGVTLPASAFASATGDQIDETLLRATGNMIDAFGLQFTLEGVDDPELVPRLQACGVHNWAGEALGTELAADELVERFATHRTVVPFAARPTRISWQSP